MLLGKIINPEGGKNLTNYGVTASRSPTTEHPFICPIFPCDKRFISLSIKPRKANVFTLTGICCLKTNGRRMEISIKLHRKNSLNVQSRIWNQSDVSVDGDIWNMKMLNTLKMPNTFRLDWHLVSIHMSPQNNHMWCILMNLSLHLFMFQGVWQLPVSSTCTSLN